MSDLWTIGIAALVGVGLIVVFKSLGGG